jgi:hypothetical protein
MESFMLPLVLTTRSPSCYTVAATAALLLFCVVGAASALWLQRPRRVAEAFRQQGIDGPPPSSFLSGNLPEMHAKVVDAAAGADQAATGGGSCWDFEKDGFDDYCKRIFPYFEKWRKAYGACDYLFAACMFKSNLLALANYLFNG